MRHGAVEQYRESDAAAIAPDGQGLSYIDDKPLRAEG